MSKCPKCQESWPSDHQCCPICGVALEAESEPSYINIGNANAVSGGVSSPEQSCIELGNANAISGGINITRTMNTTNIVERSKSDMELTTEREKRYIDQCKRCLEDFVLTNDELAELEVLRIELNISNERADVLLESVRQFVMNSAKTKRTVLAGVSKIRAKQFNDAILANNSGTVKQMLPIIEAIVEANENDDLHCQYFMVLVALDSARCIEVYEKSQNDNYWLSFWTYMAYSKQKNIVAAEKVLVNLDVKFVGYPSDNTIILASAGAVLLQNMSIAKEYISALEGNYSPMLQCLVDAINSVVNKAGSVADVGFYIEHLLTAEVAENRIKQEADPKPTLEQMVTAEATVGVDMTEHKVKRNSITALEQARRIAAADKRVVYSNDYTTLLYVKEEYKQTLKTFEVPSCVKQICKNAFRESGLESIVIPDGVVEISASAFSTNKKLKRVELPSTLRTIGEHAFRESGLESIVIPDGVVEIGASAFSTNKSLKRVELPSTLRTICKNAFRESGLESIVIPDGVVEIGAAAFYTNKGLKRVELPSTLRTIGEQAFRESGLESIVIPDGVVEIGAAAFSANKSLKGVKLPSTLRTIGKQAFQNTGVIHIVIPDSVNDVGNFAFADCVNLESILYPSDIEKLYLGTICVCPKLKDIYIFGFPKVLVKTNYTISKFNLHIYYCPLTPSVESQIKAIKDNINELYVSQLYANDYKKAFADCGIIVKDDYGESAIEKIDNKYYSTVVKMEVIRRKCGFLVDNK